MKLNNVDKAMSNGGPDIKKIDMSEFIRLADKEKIQSDINIKLPF